MRSMWGQSEAVADFSCFSIVSPEKQVQKISTWASCKFQRRSHQALSEVSECLPSAGEEQGLSLKSHLLLLRNFRRNKWEMFETKKRQQWDWNENSHWAPLQLHSHKGASLSSKMFLWEVRLYIRAFSFESDFFLFFIFILNFQDS